MKAENLVVHVGTCCFIVKLKHEHGTIEDWKAAQTNTDTVKRQRWDQGAWSREVGGDSASSAGERPTCRPTRAHQLLVHIQ